MMIRQGSCIGVLYKPPAGQCIQGECAKYQKTCHCVHNGRFVGAVTKLGKNQIHLSRIFDTSKKYHGILIRHWSNPFAKEPDYLFIPATRLQSIEVTPFKKLTNFPPLGLKCSLPPKGQPRNPNIIYPGDCVGIRFKTSSGATDIKNGRFLFWERAGVPHCKWNTKKNNHPDRVWYAHWVVRNTKKPYFHAVASSRGPKAQGKETNISIRQTTGANPAEGSSIRITFLNRSPVQRTVTYH